MLAARQVEKMLSELLSKLRDKETKYKAGTLEYTMAALMVMSLWVLWGDVCVSLMESVEPSVLPVMLKELKAPNTVVSFYVLTIVNIFAATLCPILSFKSDRYRSKRGRRIPFLSFSAPFIALFMILTGYTFEIGSFLHTNFFPGASERIVTLALLGFLVVGYQFFNMFVLSIYYYLFNDVIPEQFLGRFMAVFKAVGTGAAAVFQFFIFPHVETHGKEIFIGLGIVYFVGFTIMCLKVKEGEYPPPAPIEKRKDTFLASIIASVRTYMKECFCHKFYRYFYISNAAMMVSYTLGPFAFYRNLEVGLTLRDMGTISGISTLVTAFLLIPAGYYVDKRHPVRVGLYAMAVGLILAPLQALFLLRLDHTGVLIVFICTQAIQLPTGIIFQASEFPFMMRVLPRSRFGQFCSANALVRSGVVIVSSMSIGVMMDLLKVYFEKTLGIPGDYYYRLIFLWPLVFVSIALYFRFKLYKMWLKLGGDDNYLPPMYEEEERKYREDMEALRTNGEEKSTEEVT